MNSILFIYLDTFFFPCSNLSSFYFRSSSSYAFDFFSIFGIRYFHCNSSYNYFS